MSEGEAQQTADVGKVFKNGFHQVTLLNGGKWTSEKRDSRGGGPRETVQASSYQMGIQYPYFIQERKGATKFENTLDDSK